MLRVRMGFCSIVLMSVAAIHASAQLPIQLKENFITGLSSPVFITNAGDGTRRLFIVQQRGIIKVAQPGSSATADFLNISAVVSNSGAERGLLGLAFHPNFENNRRFFVYYTRQSDGAIEIAEYAQNAANPNIADPSPVQVIITIPHPTFTNHNGGTIAFGPDGYLYAGPGDGGSGDDPDANAQNINVLLGKIIRLDIDNVSPPLNYSIPATNPFAGATPGADEIYAYGLRNPYRFSFDRGGTNQLWVGDVGQNAIEEVDIIVSGGNYGWRVYEGTQCTGNDPQMCAGGATPITQIPPVFQYSHTGGRCSVTGGYVYRGKQNALPVGSYIYGDFCSGEIMLWNGSQQSLLAVTSTNNLVSFGEDEDGELYIVRQQNNFAPNSGSIARIVGVRTNADFDGDGGTDLSVFRPSTGAWFWNNPVVGTGVSMAWGLPTDIPIPEDYDGDGRTDIAVYRPDSGVWFIFRSSDATVRAQAWGLPTDIPVAGDFTGDRRADIAVYRPSNGSWWVLRSGAAFNYYIVNFGIAEDRPVNADYDGDGKDDIALWRASTGTWWLINSSDGQIRAISWGLPQDIPAPGDYDGDGRADVTVYRPSNGTWYVLQSLFPNVIVRPWGLSEDIPVPGDYDRDGRDDIAIYRPSNGTWWVTRSADNSHRVFSFGIAEDIPMPSTDLP